MYPIWSSMYHVYLGGPNLILIVTLLYSINLLYWTQIVLYCIEPHKKQWRPKRASKKTSKQGESKMSLHDKREGNYSLSFQILPHSGLSFQSHFVGYKILFQKGTRIGFHWPIIFRGCASYPWEAYSAPKRHSCNHSLTLFARFYVLRTYICTETSTSNAPPMPHFYKSWLRHWNYCLLFLPRNLQ